MISSNSLFHFIYIEVLNANKYRNGKFSFAHFGIIDSWTPAQSVGAVDLWFGDDEELWNYSDFAYKAEWSLSQYLWRYAENDEYEADLAYLRSSIFVFSIEIEGMEVSNQNLHHEFRTTSSATDRKLSEHTTAMANINNELEYLRKEVKEEKWRPDFNDQQKEI